MVSEAQPARRLSRLGIIDLQSDVTSSLTFGDKYNTICLFCQPYTRNC
jgi:hypothetical protein